MINFIKLTPEACLRMWLYIRWWSACKHGKSLRYQVSAKTLEMDRKRKPDWITDKKRQPAWMTALIDDEKAKTN